MTARPTTSLGRCSHERRPYHRHCAPDCGTPGHSAPGQRRPHCPGLAPFQATFPWRVAEHPDAEEGIAPWNDLAGTDVFVIDGDDPQVVWG